MLLNSDKNPFLGSTKAMGQEYEREIESWKEKKSNHKRREPKKVYKTLQM